MIQHLWVETEAGAKAAGGMSLTLLTVHGYSTSPGRLFLEGDFSASRCLPAGYASLLRNTSVSHTGCGQAHRSVLSERDGEGRGGAGLAVGKQTENRGQLCFVCNLAGAQTH